METTLIGFKAVRLIAAFGIHGLTNGLRLIVTAICFGIFFEAGMVLK